MVNNDTASDHAATTAEELFTKVTSAEEAATNISANEDALFASLSLYQTCMSIVFESSAIDLTTEQRTEFNTRMDQINGQLQQLAMSAFMD